MQSNSSSSPGSQQFPSSQPLSFSWAPLCTLSCRLCGCWGPQVLSSAVVQPCWPLLPQMALGKSSAPPAPLSDSYKCSLGVSSGFPKAAWTLWDLSPPVSSLTAPGAEIHKWECALETLSWVCKALQGQGVGPFLGKQDGNTTHSAKPGKACKC